MADCATICSFFKIVKLFVNLAQKFVIGSKSQKINFTIAFFIYTVTYNISLLLLWRIFILKFEEKNERERESVFVCLFV